MAEYWGDHILHESRGPNTGDSPLWPHVVGTYGPNRQRASSFKMKFAGVTVLQGVVFSIFLLISEWSLQQCSATALPVIDLWLVSYRRTDMQSNGHTHKAWHPPRSVVTRGKSIKTIDTIVIFAQMQVLMPMTIRLVPSRISLRRQVMPARPITWRRLAFNLKVMIKV